MLNPSKSGWIKKYMSLAKSGDISIRIGHAFDLSDLNVVQQKLASSGIIFGVFGQFIFLNYQEKFNWTPHEKLKVLYFESMLLLFMHKHQDSLNLDEFPEHLESFFESCGSRELERFWSVYKWFKHPNNIEHTIHDRTRIPLSLDQNLLVSYLQNSLCYIDVTLYFEFLQDHEKVNFRELRTKMIQLTLGTVVHSLKSDQYIEESENKLFQYFLAAADLTSKEREEFNLLLHSGSTLQVLKSARGMNILFRKYLFELAVFSTLSDTEFSSKERKTLYVLSSIFGLSETDIDDAYQIVEQFTIDHEEIITKLKSKNSYERIFNRLSAKWSKLLLRNKDKLVAEIKESGELVALVKKSMNENLTQEEKTKVKNQFFDIARSVPSLAIFMLPGGAFILPFVLKILPDLLPSAFRDNEVEE
jgi:predicted transcriptional regulator